MGPLFGSGNGKLREKAKRNRGNNNRIRLKSKHKAHFEVGFVLDEGNYKGGGKVKVGS